MRTFNPDAIKISREALGLSVISLAEKLTAISGRPYNRQSLYNWETGKYTPTADDLAILAQALNQRSIDIFFTQSDHRNDSQGGVENASKA